MGDEKDKNKSLESTSFLNVREMKNWVAPAYERSRRLGTAIYIISSLFPAGEPLTVSLRGKSLKLMSDIADTASDTAIGASAVSGIVRDIHQIMSLIEMGVAVGLISPMNAKVLEDEYEILLNSLGTQTKGQASGDVFGGLFVLKDTFKGQEEKMSFKNVQEREVLSKVDVPMMHKGQIQKRVERASVVPRQTNQTSQKNGDRKKRILESIRSKGQTGIKDIATEFKEYSEKTIQRDLADLVSEGKIKKSGERRWTIYSIV